VAKLSRAEQLLVDLENLLEGYRHDCCEVVRENRPETGEIVFTFGQLIPCPDKVSVLAGEILHNLRCPLDYLVCGHVVGDLTYSHAFPILDANNGKSRRRMAKQLEGVPDPICTIIEGLQPYQFPPAKDHPLFLLQELNNLDKHKLLHFPHVAIYKVIPRGEDDYRVQTLQTGQVKHIVPGALLVRYGVKDGADPATIKVKPYFGTEVFFRDDYLLPGQSSRMLRPLFRTLFMIKAYIHQEVFSIPELVPGFAWDAHDNRYNYVFWKGLDRVPVEIRQTKQT
jgi:hypothetical protein